MPGISAVSPPISAQPACRQPSAMPATTALATVHVELAAGEIVEEEQRLGALHDEVVDAHGDEVDADRGVLAGIDGDLELGADAVGGRDQHRVAETRRPSGRTGRRSRPDRRRRRGAASSAPSGLIRSTKPIACVDVDAGVAVGDGRVAFPNWLCHVTLEPNFRPLCLREMRRPSSFGGRWATRGDSGLKARLEPGMEKARARCST